MGEIADLEQRLAQLGKEREPPRIERLQQRRGPLEQVRGRRHVAAFECAAARGGELGRGALADRTRVVVDRAELEQVTVGLLEVVAEDLLVLGLPLPVAVDLLGPVREPLVQVGARPLEHAVVRSVADQDVLETEVVRRGRPVGADELLLGERCQVRVHLGANGVDHELVQGRAHEVQPDHRRRLDHGALVVAQQLQSLGQKRLDRPGQGKPFGQVARRPPPVLVQNEELLVDEHRDELLDEEGVALGCLDDPPANRVRHGDRPEDVLDHLAGFFVAERRQLDGRV